jgi:hypothetical protein
MQNPNPESVAHIFEILNDVKAEQLPVSDAVDSLAYWYHEAFQSGEISVEKPDPDADMINGEDIWT